MHRNLLVRDKEGGSVLGGFIMLSRALDNIESPSHEHGIDVHDYITQIFSSFNVS